MGIYRYLRRVFRVILSAAAALLNIGWLDFTLKKHSRNPKRSEG